MKRECEIVQDLLFCYCDGVASNSSKELVENHLKNCEDCSQMLRDMKQDKNEQDNSKEVDYLEKINQKMKRKTIISIISLVILVVFIIGNLYILFSFYQEGYYITITLKDEISTEQFEKIKELLIVQCGEDKITYTSKEQALSQAKEKFKDKQELLNSYSKENPFKATLLVKISQKEEKELLKLLEGVEGTSNITTNTVDNPYLWFIGKILKNIQ